MEKILLYGMGQYAEKYFSSKRYCEHLLEYFDVIGVCDGNKDKQGTIVKYFDKNFAIKDIEEFDLDEIQAILCPVTSFVFEAILREYENKKEMVKKLFRFDSYVKNVFFELPTTYRLSIVLIIKNESSYIEEWIKYHRLVGVDHFYIYDNESEDGLYDVIKNYIDSGMVTYCKWDKYQYQAYEDAISKYKNETKYMAFIDSDEYIVTLQNDSVLETIHNIFTEYEAFLQKVPETHAGGIGVNWRMYGTSGHKSKPKGYVIENFLYRAEDEFEENAHIKSIVNQRTVSNCDMHLMSYWPGFQCISEKGSAISEPFFYDGTCSKLRINHYYSKSEEELLAKFNRGWMSEKMGRRNLKGNRLNSFEKRKEQLKVCNKVYDPIMLSYVEQMHL